MKAVRRAVAMAAGGQPACGKRIRVVTYNLLSSSLADPGYFPRCDPANLDADTRLRRIERALAEEMRPCQEANGGRGAVLCLQEVSTKWLYVHGARARRRARGASLCSLCSPRR